MAAQVVPTAKARPGKCVLSGETQGPFIDTGKSIPRYGRVYISLKWLRRPIKDLGYRSEEEVEEILTTLEEQNEELERLSEVETDYQTLVEAVTPYLPTPEPEVREKEVIRHRQPTDEEIQDWIERKGGSHPAVVKARPYEKGSSEEWFALYGHTPAAQPTSPQRPLEEETEQGTEENYDEGPPNVVELFGQAVDLDKVLSENVSEVVTFAEDKDDNFIAALVRREFFLAKKNERSVRKGVLQPLGYWDDEDDEPLIPMDEDTENEDNSEDEEE